MSKNDLIYQDFNEDVYKDEWRWQEGEYTVTRTAVWSGPGCHAACGVLAYTKDGKVVKVEGDPRAGFNHGRLCMRCLDMMESINHKDRLKYPLLRVGERGSNEWKRISWDEAFDWIEEKYKEICEEVGPWAIDIQQGTGRNCLWQPAMVAKAIFGTPNNGPMISGDSCYQPRNTATMIKSGDVLVADCAQMHPDRFDHPGYVNPEVMIIWGNGPLEANADGFLGHWIVDLMRLGTKLIVIDPKLVWMAAKAEMWLRVRPGTASALALGFLNVIINEDLYDHEFVDNWTIGFEELAEKVQQYPPSKVAEITTIPEEDIIKAARRYATAKPAAVQWGVALDMQLGAFDVASAIADMEAMCGNLDAPGGNIMVRYAYNSSVKYGAGAHLISEEVTAKRIGTAESPMHNSGYLPVARPDGVINWLKTGEPYPCLMQWHQGCNPISCCPGDATAVFEYMHNVRYHVVVDLYMTPTAVAFADLVLPAAMSLERDSFRSWWQPLRAITKCADNYYESKSDEEIIFELGKRLRPDYFGEFKDVHDMLTNTLYQGGAGIDYSWEELSHRVEDWWEWDEQYYKYKTGLLRGDGLPGFVTFTGKYEFTPPLMDIWGWDTTPNYIPPYEDPQTAPERCEGYPYILTTGNRNFGMFHSEHRQLPTIREFYKWPTCNVSPKTAEELGVVDGDWLWMESKRGKFKQQVKINLGLADNVICAEHAWWFPEREGAEPELFGTFDSNPNNATTWGIIGPTFFGAPYKSLVCKAYKVTPENDHSETVEVVNRVKSKRGEK